MRRVRPWVLAGACLAVQGLPAPTAAQAPDPLTVGDVNGDGRVTAVDALAVLAHVQGLPVPTGFEVDPGGDAACGGTLLAPDPLLWDEPGPVRDVSAPAITPEDADLILAMALGLDAPEDSCTGLEVDRAWGVRWGGVLGHATLPDPVGDTLVVPVDFRFLLWPQLVTDPNAPDVERTPASQRLIRFESRDGAVASVSETWDDRYAWSFAVVTPRSEGETDLVIRWFENRDTLHLRVVPWEPTELQMRLEVMSAVDSVSRTALLAVGDTARPVFQIADALGARRRLSPDSLLLASDHPDVVSLASDGLVEARSLGEGRLVATQGAVADTVLAQVVESGALLEAALTGTFRRWWWVNHDWYPGPALSMMADDHTTAWSCCGMQGSGLEPRVALENDPEWAYRKVLEVPWTELHLALFRIRKGLRAVDDGTIAANDPDRALRFRAFGAFVQGLARGTLAQLFDQTILISESVDPDHASFVSYEEMLDSALASLDRSIALAESGSPVVPQGWVGDNGDWDGAHLAGLAHGFKARFLASVPRTPEERSAVDWSSVLAEVEQAHTRPLAVWGDPSQIDDYWSFVDKTYAASDSGWARTDLRTLGPAHAGSEFAEWLARPPFERLPFPLDTDDARITGQVDTDADGALWDETGLYLHYAPNPFPASRGTYHGSDYLDHRWGGLRDGPAEYVDFPLKELEFLRAEALYRLGDPASAMAVVNTYRANGDLPAFTDPASAAPGGDRCVPRPDGLECGGLWEALKYEKRIELFHYGLGTAYFDDRGWGDLVTGTPLHFPVPASVLVELGLPIYTFGGEAGSSAPAIIDGVSLGSYLRSLRATEPERTVPPRR